MPFLTEPTAFFLAYSEGWNENKMRNENIE